MGAPDDGDWAEVGAGVYLVRLNATDCNTAGPLLVRVVSAGCDDAVALCHVAPAWAVAGDAMALTGAYDAAKTAAPTASAIRSEMEGAGTKLTETHATVQTNLDAKVSEIGGDDVPTVEEIVEGIEAETGLLYETHATVQENLDAKLSTIGGAVGPGGSLNTLHITADGQPVSDADVWISVDAPGQIVIAGTLQTNAAGYLWAQKSGYNLPQGEEFIAT